MICGLVIFIREFDLINIRRPWTSEITMFCSEIIMIKIFKPINIRRPWPPIWFYIFISKVCFSSWPLLFYTWPVECFWLDVCVCACVCVRACMRACVRACVCVCVTGFWKTDQIVTLGLFHFIAPANGYTCTLHIHSAITRLGWLVCFSRASLPTKCTTETMGPVEGATWKAWV